MSLVKVTKIKKGLVVFNDCDQDNSTGEVPLKCPKCNLVHLISEDEIAVYEEVMGVDAIKERVKKRNEAKLQQMTKAQDG